MIRAGGKQYRVAPGDVIRVEKTPADQGRIEFSDVLAVSPTEGQISQPGEARVVGQVVEEERGDKVLVFHYKRKKQYKKIAGHRQPFTAVRITEIAFDGQRFTAAEPPETEKKPRPAKPKAAAPPEPTAEAAPRKAAKKSARKKAAKKPAPKKRKR